MKLWNEMNEAEREAFKLTDAYLDPTNPARVPWGEWSVAAQDACWGAERRGKPVSRLSVVDKSWYTINDPVWASSATYRLPPEPKRETVRITGQLAVGEWGFVGGFNRDNDTHAITFPTGDGKPVLTKCPHCGTAPIDMEEL